MMLPSENRIIGSKRVEEVKEKGRIIQGENFGLVKFNRKDDGPPKFAFVISTKISKLAVNRNRIKRSLHEGIRRNLRDIPKGYDFVLLTRKGIAGKTTEEIIEEVTTFFLRHYKK
jgi:ribonuclease P protein component